jgi:acyl carrier protein
MNEGRTDMKLSERQIEKRIVHEISMLLGVPEESVAVDKPFIDLGLDSMQAVALCGNLERWVGRRLEPTLVWDYPTIDAVAKHLAGSN